MPILYLQWNLALQFVLVLLVHCQPFTLKLNVFGMLYDAMTGKALAFSRNKVPVTCDHPHNLLWILELLSAKEVVPVEAVGTDYPE